MTQDRWSEVKQLIRDSFTVLEEYEEQLDPGHAEVVEFETPQGILKASFNRQPKVEGKKTLYSHRSGGSVRVDYTYSETDEVSYFTIDRWDDASEQWIPVDANGLF
ncbi:MAG: hypothetical protein HY422_01525 [Candidatus Komeilibacteria bacterium]|nr:hypothetical protein [Candidatus Komeilibacteria bacterium]